MQGPLNLNDPIAVLLRVSEVLRASGIEVAAYGGLALAAYGEPRETRDADFAVAGVGGEQASDALRRTGLQVVVAFDRMPFGGNLVTRITLLPDGGATGLNVADLVEPRSTRFSRLALERAIEGTLRHTPVRLLSPEDFVLFKLLSTRERDLEDAATVLRGLGAAIDLAAIDEEAHRLASEIPDHDMAGRLGRLHASLGA